MVFRSRSLRLLLLAPCCLVLALGPIGCASAKPREKWWQFWRPKKAAATSMYHPDRVILPPPPDALGAAGAGGESAALGRDAAMLTPPDPVGEIPDFGEPEPIRVAGQPSGDLLTVNFEYDSAQLSAEAKSMLDHNLAWILANPGVEIQIEGHCDERGTVEYNMLLGDRRAKAVKAYLVSRGISDATLHTISYGEERPVEPGASETAMAKNRRAQFLVF